MVDNYLYETDNLKFSVKFLILITVCVCHGGIVVSALAC